MLTSSQHQGQVREKSLLTGLILDRRSIGLIGKQLNNLILFIFVLVLQNKCNTIIRISGTEILSVNIANLGQHYGAPIDVNFYLPR